MQSKIVLVTGGGEGLGRVFAERLAQAGAMVILLGRHEATLQTTVMAIHAQGGQALSFVADVTNQDQVTAVMLRIAEQVGVVDVLINNAGILGPIDYGWKIDPQVWWQTMQVNVLGALLCMQAVIPSMMQRRSGIIINIVSRAGAFRWPTLSAYSVSKAALIKLTENMAVELFKSQIAVFAYHPGVVDDTGLEKQLMDYFVNDGEKDPMMVKFLAWFQGERKKGRTVPAVAAAAGVIALASSRYNALSGRYLTVYDDLDFLKQHSKQIRKDDLLLMRVQALNAETAKAKLNI